MPSQAAWAAWVSGWQKETELICIKRWGKKDTALTENPSHDPHECCAHVLRVWGRQEWKVCGSDSSLGGRCVKGGKRCQEREQIDSE